MDLLPGDLVEIVAVPAWVDRLGSAQQEVYRICLGVTLAIEAIDRDGRCVFELHQEWHHFPDVLPFSLTFDAACVRKIEQFSDSDWAAIAGWMESSSELLGEVIEDEGKLTVLLEGGLLGHLALPEGAETDDHLGRTIGVRVIQANRRKRVLVVYPIEA